MMSKMQLNTTLGSNTRKNFSAVQVISECCGDELKCGRVRFHCITFHIFSTYFCQTQDQFLRELLKQNRFLRPAQKSTINEH